MECVAHPAWVAGSLAVCLTAVDAVQWRGATLTFEYLNFKRDSKMDSSSSVLSSVSNFLPIPLFFVLLVSHSVDDSELLHIVWKHWRNSLWLQRIYILITLQDGFLRLQQFAAVSSSHLHVSALCLHYVCGHEMCFQCRTGHSVPIQYFSSTLAKREEGNTWEMGNRQVPKKVAENCVNRQKQE